MSEQSDYMIESIAEAKRAIIQLDEIASVLDDLYFLDSADEIAH